MNEGTAAGDLHLQLRGYQSTDLDAIFRLDKVCFEPVFRFSRASMRRFAEAANAHVVIAEIEQQIAGFCIVHGSDVLGEKAGYVVTLDVAPEHRRKGIAARLMREAEAQACNAGCSAMFLHVFTGNASAISFYEREGYEFQSKALHFYGRGVDALVYRKLLV